MRVRSLAVGVGGDVAVSIPGVPGLLDLVAESCPLVGDLLVLLDEFLGHLVHVEAVDLSEMRGGPVLECVDGRDRHAVLDVLQGGASGLGESYYSTW